MRSILIVNGLLGLGGAEKLVYELATFAQKKNIRPTVLILDNYAHDYYDDIFIQKNVKVVKTRLQNIKNLRAPLKMCRSIYWSIKLRYFADKFYESIHVVGLYHIYKIKDTIPHENRFFWHVTNAIQEANGLHNFHDSCFDDKQDTIVCINRYQINELKTQYGELLKCKLQLLKLFVND